MGGSPAASVRTISRIGTRRPGALPGTAYVLREPESGPVVTFGGTIARSWMFIVFAPQAHGHGAANAAQKRKPAVLCFEQRGLASVSCPFAGMTRIRFKGFSRFPAQRICKQGVGELSAP